MKKSKKQKDLDKLQTKLDKEKKKADAEQVKKEEADMKAARKAVTTPLPLPPEHLTQQHVEKEITVKRRSKLGWWGRRKLQLFASQTFLIMMEYSNGTSKLFVLKSSKEVFKHKGRMYYLRYEDALYNLTHGQYILRFHEDYPVPIDRAIHKNKDEDQTDPEKKKAYWSVTSHNLKPLIKMEYVKALAEAQELSKYLKLGLVISLVILLIVAFLAVQVYRLAPFA